MRKLWYLLISAISLKSATVLFTLITLFVYIGLTLPNATFITRYSHENMKNIHTEVAQLVKSFDELLDFFYDVNNKVVNETFVNETEHSRLKRMSQYEHMFVNDSLSKWSFSVREFNLFQEVFTKIIGNFCFRTNYYISMTHEMLKSDAVKYNADLVQDIKNHIYKIGNLNVTSFYLYQKFTNSEVYSKSAYIPTETQITTMKSDIEKDGVVPLKLLHIFVLFVVELLSVTVVELVTLLYICYCNMWSKKSFEKTKTDETVKKNAFVPRKYAEYKIIFRKSYWKIGYQLEVMFASYPGIQVLLKVFMHLVFLAIIIPICIFLLSFGIASLVAVIRIFFYNPLLIYEKNEKYTTFVWFTALSLIIWILLFIPKLSTHLFYMCNFDVNCSLLCRSCKCIWRLCCSDKTEKAFIDIDYGTLSDTDFRKFIKHSNNYINLVQNHLYMCTNEEWSILHTGSIPERLAQTHFIKMLDVHRLKHCVYKDLVSDHDVMLVLKGQQNVARMDNHSGIQIIYAEDVQFVKLALTDDKNMLLQNLSVEDQGYKFVSNEKAKGLLFNMASTVDINAVNRKFNLSYLNTFYNLPEIMTGKDTKVSITHASVQVNQTASHWRAENNSCGHDYDLVFAIRAQKWPDCTKPWFSRARPSGWPDEDLKTRMVAAGCHVIPKPTSEDDKFHWRWSFSKAETLCLMKIPRFARRAYLATKMIYKSKNLKHTSPEVKSYHLKSMFLWYLESHDTPWKTNRTTPVFQEYVNFVCDSLKRKECKHYFLYTSADEDSKPLNLFQNIINVHGLNELANSLQRNAYKNMGVYLWQNAFCLYRSRSCICCCFPGNYWAEETNDDEQDEWSMVQQDQINPNGIEVDDEQPLLVASDEPFEYEDDNDVPILETV